MFGKRTPEGIRCAACAVVLWLAGQLASLAYPNDLGGAVWTNGQFQFTLNHWQGVTSAVVESSPDMVNWTPVQTNSISSVQFPISVAAPDNMAFYRMVAYPIPFRLFAYVLGAVTNINMNGNSLITDSYNSADTNLSTNGQYVSAKASTNGSVASGGGIVNLGVVTISGNLYLGSNAVYSSSATNVTGTIYSNYNVQFPDVFLPTTDASSNAVVWLNAPGNSSFHDFTVNGYYWVNNSGTITVEPGVTVALQVTVQNFNPSSITLKGGITNSGSLVIYHNPVNPGGIAILGANAIGGPIGNRPVNFIYFGLPNVSNIILAGTGDFSGAIYAPAATMTMNGGGAIINVDGSLIVGWATENGHYHLHFDENLLTNGPVGYHY